MSSKKLGRAFISEARNFRVQPEQTSGCIQKYFESLDCPRSLSCWLMFKYSEHSQLADLGFDPLFYSNVEQVRTAYAATKFLSKFKGLSLDSDLDKVALLKFEKFENQCKQTNYRFKHPTFDALYKGDNVWLHNAVKQKISRILGDFSIDELADAADWGPGASTMIKSRDACSANKFQIESGITRDLYALFFDWTHLFGSIYPKWGTHLSGTSGFPCFQIGNKVVTVPKDASQNRVIAIEPGINLWFQKGIGSMIKRRLLRWGIDLNDQSRNQYLAKIGSKNLKLATVDFSSASDSISLEVVRELIPDVWFQIMDSSRSHYGHLNNSNIKWEKFSSMGNGFTFELESLIFFAAASCCVEKVCALGSDRTVSVYGDDVIIPVECFEVFSNFSEYLGFTVNRKKSHYLSTFRESCGAHYCNGIDVKPIYLKDKLSNIPSVYRLANAIRRQAHSWGSSHYPHCDTRFRSTFYSLMKLVPKTHRLLIPANLGDGGFICNFDEATPARAPHWIEGYNVKNLVESSILLEFDGEGLLLTRLWSTSVVELRNTVTSRGRTRLRISRSLVSQWYDLGPWL